jgi:hypothetical protein
MIVPKIMMSIKVFSTNNEQNIDAFSEHYEAYQRSEILSYIAYLRKQGKCSSYNIWESAIEISVSMLVVDAAIGDLIWDHHHCA